MKKSIPFLDLAVQHRFLVAELEQKFAQMLQQGIFAGGEEITLLEQNVVKYLNVEHVIACSNGTDALEMGLKVLGIGPGDEVIVPALTWIATAEAVSNTGAIPVFAEVGEDGLMELNRLEKWIGTKTKAIVPVHLYGKMVDMPVLMKLARQYGLKVVEDSAQAFGAFWDGKSAGSFGDIGCFSFYPTKNLGALGEAGMLVTKEADLAKQLKWLGNHGQSSRDKHEIAGRNAKMDPLQAGFLNVKLQHYPAWQVKRKALAALYIKQLSGLYGLQLPENIHLESHNAHLFTICLDKRDQLKDYLEESGIGTSIHYSYILPRTKAFYKAHSCPVAEKISKSTLSLPLNPFMTEEEVIYISSKIRNFFGGLH